MVLAHQPGSHVLVQMLRGVCMHGADGKGAADSSVGDIITFAVDVVSSLPALLQFESAVLLLSVLSVRPCLPACSSASVPFLKTTASCV